MNEVLIEEFSTLFGSIVDLKSCVVWVRNFDYSKQLYLSQSYESIWEVPCQTLYQSPESFKDSLLDVHQEVWFDRLIKRTPQSDQNPTAYYAINTSSGRVKFIKDSAFYLHDKKGKFLANAGIAYEIPEAQWRDERLKSKEMITSKAVTSFEACLQQLQYEPVSPVVPPKVNGLNLRVEGLSIPFTRQQLTCLYHLLCGKTMRETALLLNRSPRTVESHLAIVREKLHCRNKVELMNKVSERGLLQALHQ